MKQEVEISWILTEKPQSIIINRLHIPIKSRKRMEKSLIDSRISEKTSCWSGIMAQWQSACLTHVCTIHTQKQNEESMLYVSLSYKLWTIKCDENVKSQVTTKRKNIKYISITWVELCEEKIFHGKIRKNLNNVDISWDEKTEYMKYIYYIN